MDEQVVWKEVRIRLYQSRPSESPDLFIPSDGPACVSPPALARCKDALSRQGFLLNWTLACLDIHAFSPSYHLFSTFPLVSVRDTTGAKYERGNFSQTSLKPRLRLLRIHRRPFDEHTTLPLRQHPHTRHSCHTRFPHTALGHLPFRNSPSNRLLVTYLAPPSGSLTSLPISSALLICSQLSISRPSLFGILSFVTSYGRHCLFLLPDCPWHQQNVHNCNLTEADELHDLLVRNSPLT
ncbi:hypothetical protein B0T13DRAFT_198773 [Neurospora crassa]|nr:hypothetical protein B0T13DRAFT_198773 [Neurospora crassa]